MAHDLGHPPFGHIGESELNRIVAEHHDDGFEGNAQSFRIVTKLAIRSDVHDGINLTRATLAACLKYPWFREKDSPQSQKWSAYRSEKEEFEFAREFHPHQEKTLEAELMDWADDVAYSVHDLEDFHRCNALPWRRVFADEDKIIEHAMKGAKDDARQKRLKDAYDRLRSFFNGTYSELLGDPYEGAREQREQLRRMTSQMIGKYIGAIKINEDQSSDKAVILNEDHVDEVLLLKQITRDYIIASPTLAAQQQGQRLIIKELYENLSAATKNKGAQGFPDFLPVRLRYLRKIAGDSTDRFVADCIASLSEHEAVALHARLTGAVTGSILDPIVR